MSRKKKQQATIRKNQNAYQYWITRILNLASSAVRWEGLPDYIDTVLLENCLNRTGSAILCYDDVTDHYYVGQNASVGNIDIYGYPLDRRVIFLNGQNAKFTPETSVIIYNNSMRTSELWIYEYYAKRLADMDVAVDVNMQSQKTMPMIPANQAQALTIENIYSDIENNIPYVLLDPSSINIDQFKQALTFDNRRSFTADLMIQVQRELWNRMLTYIGINNVNIEKRERTNVPEVNSNLDEILIMRRNRLNCREFACRQIKEVMGLDVKVGYYSDGKGGEGDGGIYDRTEDYSYTDLRDKIPSPGGNSEADAD